MSVGGSLPEPTPVKNFFYRFCHCYLATTAVLLPIWHQAIFYSNIFFWWIWIRIWISIGCLNFYLYHDRFRYKNRFKRILSYLLSPLVLILEVKSWPFGVVFLFLLDFGLKDGKLNVILGYSWYSRVFYLFFLKKTILWWFLCARWLIGSWYIVNVNPPFYIMYAFEESLRFF